MQKSTIGAAAALFILALSTAAADANPSIVVDVATGQVLEAEEATRPWVPASTTKMMTAYLALKAIRDGKARLDSPLQVSALAARQRPVKVYLKPGQIITLDNALKIMLVKSANDLAYVVAEGIGGSVGHFADMMNAEAARLGMTQTHFVNPNGWDAPGHQSSARDLAILARAILTDFPQYEGYFGIGAVALGKRVFKNTNGLIGRYPGAMGMKTGFVCASGFNVVAVAERGGRRLIAVVLGAGSGADRTVQAARLLDQGFAKTGGSGTLESLPASGYASAPNVCAELRKRGVPLQDDYESDAAIVSHQDFNQDGANPAYAMLLQQGQHQARGALVARSANGRVVLGPRSEFEPIPVYLGRAPGSTLPILAGIDRPSVAPAALPASAMAMAPAEEPAGGQAKLRANAPRAIMTPSAPVGAAVVPLNAPAAARRTARTIHAPLPLTATAPAAAEPATAAQEPLTEPSTEPVTEPAAAPAAVAAVPSPPASRRRGKLDPIWPSAASQGLTRYSTASAPPANTARATGRKPAKAAAKTAAKKAGAKAKATATR